MHIICRIQKLRTVPQNKAEMAWLLYDLVPQDNSFVLKKVDTVYTRFSPALIAITTAKPGNVNDFIKVLQDKLDQQLETPPQNQTIDLSSLRRK